MKRLYFVFSLILCLLAANLSLRAQEPKREFRATWIATVSCIDWPNSSSRGTTAAKIQAQKNELIQILDALEAGNLNATMLQIRPASDAFYTSTREPWSQWISGTRGTSPNWDPLAFAVQEAHRRGIELHCWINPYRYEINHQHNTYPQTDPIRRDHPEWILDYNNGSFDGTVLDPGQPAVRQYVTEIIAEIVQNYDIDGVIFDDYFYPYGGTTTEDATSKAQYKPANMSDGDWRRSNVDKTVEMVYDTIQALKPWVRFGIGPFGIWTTSSSAATRYGITLPQGITGMNAYEQIYCNTLEWMLQGTVDYVSPQLYWSTASTGQDYDVLTQWWSDMAKHFTDLQQGGKKIHYFSSVAAYKMGNSSYAGYDNTNEMNLEVQANRRSDQLGAPGIVFYNTTSYRQCASNIISSSMKEKSLAPAMDWKPAPEQPAPTNVRINGSTIEWDHTGCDRFSVYVYPKGWDPNLQGSNRYLRQVVWGNSLETDITDFSETSIAVCAFDRYGNEFAPGFFNKAEQEERDTINTHVTGIRLRVKEYTMNAGETFTLKPTVTPSSADVKDVVWSSDDERIASVESTTNISGTVTAQHNGTCIITGTTVDGGFTCTCTITVVGGTEDTALDAPQAEKKPMLIYEGGQLRISTADGTYTISGQKVN